MHPYTIDTGMRKKILWMIFIVSIILSSILTYWLEGSIMSVRNWLQQFAWISQIVDICDGFGVTTNFIGVPFLYVAIYYFFDNVLWRTKWFKKILNVPDLRGHWEGTLTSNTYQKTINMIKTPVRIPYFL